MVIGRLPCEPLNAFGLNILLRFRARPFIWELIGLTKGAMKSLASGTLERKFMAKNIELTIDEKCLIKDILNTIMADDDLRKGFRSYCNTSVPQMRKIAGKLTDQVREAAIEPMT